MRTVVITGLGACTSSGATFSETWRCVSGPEDRPPLPVCATSRFVDMDAFSASRQLAIAAVAEALQQAGLWAGNKIRGVARGRVGSTFSASKPFLPAHHPGSSPILMHGASESDLTPDVMRPCDDVGVDVSRYFGIGGECRNVVAACATGVYSAAVGAMWIEEGLCDVVIAGSVEPPAHPLYRAGFERMGVLTPEAIMRPFDLYRRGFVMGFGAGVLVLESAAHARRRGQKALAALTGWGLGADGHGRVAFNSGGQRIADVIGRALSRARLAASQISHVNAHGTATPLNDRLETQALQKAFGAHAARIRISATKSSTGHLLGAAGSVEAALTVESLQRQFIAPTRRLETPDPECPLDYTPGEGQIASFDHALTLSFGFGGSIGALVFSRC